MVVMVVVVVVVVFSFSFYSSRFYDSSSGYG